MSGETIVTVNADQVVVVSDSVPPPGVADVAAAVAASTAQAQAAQAAAVATAADRVATGLDSAATAGDRVQSGLDVNATGGDRVQTGLAAVATAADRVATGQDRAQTGLDKIATAADRVQTGQDRAAAAVSRSAIDNRIYPGAYVADPATRPDGSASAAGDEYFNSVASLNKRYNGAAWVASDINTANLAATSGASLVGYDGGTVQAVLDGGKTMQSYTALRAYTGRAIGVRITSAGVGGFFFRDGVDVTTADNGGTVIVDGSGRRWKRLYEGAVQVAWFGPVGDGVADDTTPFLSAIAAAGTCGAISVTPNKVFLISASLNLLFGQSLIGNGSTLKRAPQRYTVTTGATVVGGVTNSFTVADGTQLRDWDIVAFADETMGSKYNYSSAQPINAPAGNTVAYKSGALATVSGTAMTDQGEYPYIGGAGSITPSNFAFPIGTKVAVCYSVIEANSHCSVYDLKIDGNKANQVVGHWDLYSEIHTSAHDANLTLNSVLFDRVHITNFASEAFQEGGGAPAPYASADDYAGPITADEATSCVNIVYRNCRITNGRGNGIHLSGVNRPRIEGCFFYGLNQDYGVGHVGGAVCISFTGSYIDMVGNYVEKCYAGIGILGIHSVSHTVIRGNTFKDCYAYGINGLNGSAGSSGVTQIIIADNIFNNCNQVFLASWQANPTRGSEFQMHDNLLSGTGITVDSLDNVSIHHNTIRNDFFVPLQCSAGAVAANATTLTLPSTAAFTVNQSIYASLNGVVSPQVKIVSKTATVLTLNRAIQVAFASAPWINDTERMPNTLVTTGQTITSGVTKVYPVNDATHFRVGQFIRASSLATGAYTTPSRVLAVDVVSTPNTITTQSAADRTWTAGAGDNVIHVWPSSFDATGCGSIVSMRCTPVIESNIIVGGAQGVFSDGGIVRNNTISKFRCYGVIDAAAGTTISGNKIAHDATFSAGWAIGIWTQGNATKNRITQNEVTAAASSQVCCQISGSHSVVDGNMLRAFAGAAAGKSLQADGSTYNDIKNNYVSVAMTGTAGARTTTENIESGTVVMA